MTRRMLCLVAGLVFLVAIPVLAQDDSAESALRAEIAALEGEPRAARLADLALLLEKQGRPFDAAHAWRQAREIAPTPAVLEGEARSLLAFADWLLQTDEHGASKKAAFEDARIALERARDGGVDTSFVGVGLARCAEAGGSADDQIRILRETLVAHPADPAATRALGFALLVAGQHAEGAKILAALSDASPSDWKLALGGSAAAREAGDEDTALRLAARAVEMDPAAAEGWMAVWRIYAPGKRYGELADQVVALAEAHPESAVGAHYAGFAAASASRVEPALTWLARAAERDPHNVEALLEAARIQQTKKSDTAAATALYEKVLAVRPGEPSAVRGLQYLAAKVHWSGRPQDAVPLFETIAKTAPDMGIHWADLGLALRWSGRYEESEDAYRRAVEVSDGDPQILNDYGLLLLVMGRDEDADEVFRAAHESDALANDGPENLGFVARERGDLAAAARWFRTAWEAAIRRGEDGARHRRNLDDVTRPLPPLERP